MAKISVVARQNKREKMVALYAERRAKMKAEGDYEGLDKLPRNALPVRLRNRCQLTGRPRAYIRYFGMSRIKFRDLASQGRVPGVVKASW